MRSLDKTRLEQTLMKKYRGEILSVREERYLNLVNLEYAEVYRTVSGQCEVKADKERRQSFAKKKQERSKIDVEISRRMKEQTPKPVLAPRQPVFSIVPNSLPTHPAVVRNLHVTERRVSEAEYCEAQIKLLKEMLKDRIHDPADRARAERTIFEFEIRRAKWRGSSVVHDETDADK